MNPSFEFAAEHFTAGTVGEPGDRTFFLQAADGGRLVTLKIEKQQVGALSEYFTQLLTELDLPDDGADFQPLRTPIEPDWVVGSLEIQWDADAEQMVVVAEEIQDDDDESDPARAVFRVSASQVSAFCSTVDVLMAGGRPPCPFCGRPKAESEPCWGCPAMN
ncbi:MAG: DUF3090 family protein [Actinomycetia bacterium]|nr:DUF3090 family protein [Actinomycetes bacterium]